MSEARKVLFLAAEAAPYSKVGGLADFAGELPAALRELGLDVRLMMPRYGAKVAGGSAPSSVRPLGRAIQVPVGPMEEPAYVIEASAALIPTYLISNEQYFSSRERVYGFGDDAQRFVYFSRAVVAAVETLGWTPDLIHANDWHTAAVPAWLGTYGRSSSVHRKIASLFTVHSLAYQGVYGRLLLSFGRMSRVPHLSAEQPGKVNWVAQGIAHSDVVNTVSPSYAAQMRSGELDSALKQLLVAKGERFVGIPNGIDMRVWDPAADSALVQAYDAHSTRLRAVNKTALQRELQLNTDPSVPLLGLVTRLDRTKGIEILVEAISDLLQQREAQFALLGTGEAEYETSLKELQARFPRNVRVACRFDDRLARRFYAGLDLYLAPSLTEPASTGVLLAMRYGAVPVVRMTGGLRDSVIDYRSDPRTGTGFGFEEYSSRALGIAIGAALEVLGTNHQGWLSIQCRAMSIDHSWATSARRYAALYEDACRAHEHGSP